MSSSGSTHTRVSPHRRNAEKPEAWADRTMLAVRGGRLHVRDARNREYHYRLATGSHHDAVAAMVVARIRNADTAGDGITEEILLVTADRRIVCSMPAFGWNRDELQAFSTAAGLRFGVEDIGNFRDLRRAFPKVHGAHHLPLYTRKGMALGAVVLLVVMVAIGAVLVAVSL